MFPVTLSLKGRRCLVVGGGSVASRKARSLVTEQARVTVVAPEATPTIEEMAQRRQLSLEKRPYTPGEAAAYTLVFAATNRREVNRQVFEDADGHGVWANVADDPELCSFHLPARVSRGPLELAISTRGRAPFATRRLRQLLESRLGPEWADWAEAAAQYRSELRGLELTHSEREARFDQFFAETVDPLLLRARSPDAGSQLAGAPGRARGFVSLVGAGPGNPGLLTERGRQRLFAADVVLYDRLAAPALPCELPERVSLQSVGKAAGRHPVPQAEIIERMLRLAGEGKRVVRFKGGDPYVFGRGSEEAEALAEAGIGFEVVPGVTSGIAAASWVGVPVTHRQEAVRVTLLTAHESQSEAEPRARWDLLAQDRHATLVAYMGLAALPKTVDRLLAGGMPPETPAAMVQSGTTSSQRSVVATLEQLPAEVSQAGLTPPALFVVGPTVHHAKRLDWFSRRPLVGERLVAPQVSVDLSAALEAAGADVIATPLPLTPAARIVIGALPVTGCVAATVAQIVALDGERRRGCWPEEPTAWCLGPEVAARARDCDWSRVETVEAGTRGWALVERIEASRRA